MTNIDIANGMVLRAMNGNKDSFGDEAIIQKKIYLLQGAGTELGYSFDWYVNGPYSADLSAYLYNNSDMLSEEDFSRYEMSPVVKEKAAVINSMVASKPEYMTADAWYELLASVLYIKKKWGDMSGEIGGVPSEQQSRYSKQEIDIAEQALIDTGLF